MRWHLIARPGQQFFLGTLGNSHERKWDRQRRWVERITTVNTDREWGDIRCGQNSRRFLHSLSDFVLCCLRSYLHALLGLSD